MDTWEHWWRQAQFDLEVCDLLHGCQKWAPCCFFAQQAIEKSLKALARKPTTFGNLDTVTFNDLSGYSFGQLGAGGDQCKVRHDLAKGLNDLHVFHRKSLQGFDPDLRRIEQENIGESTRYPDAKRPSGPLSSAPCDAFSSEDATWLKDLAHKILSVVSSRI